MSTTSALMSGHYFTSGPISPRGAARVVNEARCECGHPLAWETRDVDHARHLLAVAFETGAAAVVSVASDFVDPDSLEYLNPFEETP